MLSLQRVAVYRAALELVILVRKVRNACPRGTEPLRRAARSIEQNLAEGLGTSAPSDRAAFFAIARASVMECIAHLDELRAEDLMVPADQDAALMLLARIVAMLRP